MGCGDEELMQDLQRGEMEAFDALYERHARLLFNFIRRLLRDESLAEDVFQETCMRVLDSAGRFDPRARFRTWLYTVAHNLCMDELRRRRRRMSIPAGELPGPPPAPDPHDRLERRRPRTGCSGASSRSSAPSSCSASCTGTRRRRRRGSSAPPWGR